ncbi:1-acyl-sn-glycerol-3-phosphate acyltransferase epsilon-like [Oopsacas minuta]|uniref:1-acyl-sn-glycerol-3-phosphate acyltransferase epsilon-like n=1 Tax=Oopsacas minuta TaxID=111878 RepID=A0AAV7JSW6_9METZ|nr:1-acyl-sn-glycerol-3-phosphate acyltransferase epsilon-like [Oopsacas minuta]
MLLLTNIAIQTFVNNRVLAFSSVLSLCSCCFTTWSIALRTIFFFSPKLHEITTRTIISSYIVIQMFPLCTMNGVKLIITGDKLPENPERVLYITNHQSWIDWLLIEMFAVKSNASGLTSYIIKNSIKYIPYYGLQLYLNGCVYIRRNRQQDAVLMGRFSRWLEGKVYNYWIVLFPEGTRFDRNNITMIEKSKQIAVQKGYAPLNNVLFPKPGGFQILTQSLGHYFEAIYDVTIAYPNGDNRIPNFIEFARGDITVIHMHINRVPFNQIAGKIENEEMLHDWLYNTYKEKDNRLEQFYETGQLANTPSEEYRLSYKYTFPTVCFYLLFCLPLLLTTRGRGFWWKLSVIYVFGGTLISSIFL